MSLIKILTILAMAQSCPDSECVDLPHIETPPVQQVGKMSFYNAPYGDNGLRGDGITASGELLTRVDLTIAHRTLPMHSVVLLEDPATGNRLWVRVNDSGPFGCLDEQGDWHVAVWPIDGCEYRGIGDMNWPVANALGVDKDKGLNTIKIRYFKKGLGQRQLSDPLVFKE